ncbi:MAG: hypothetical protein B7O98_02015 [Zestosphaera tikiterensis]|uniref:Uncharacterized protein n=1 Tax=Zestosphaera tikiterensis TaxID=1973259 RepID=A0A2R7Y6S4_9CREN|nr:MAG: hypothetical protein B7O98_02015 [Zestosphaera tikiterensis]
MLVLPEIIRFVSWDILENLLNMKVTYRNVYLRLLNYLPVLVVLSSDSTRSIFKVNENLEFDLISRVSFELSDDVSRLGVCSERLSRYALFDGVLNVCVGKNSEGYYEFVKDRVVRPGRIKHFTFNDLLVVTACRGRKCYVLMLDLLTGSYKEHVIKASDIESVICSKNICVVKGEDRCFSVSLTSEEAYEVLCELQPLISCGNFNYFFDGVLIVKHVKDLYEPIFPLSVEYGSLCCYEGDIVVNSKEGVCLLKDHLLLKLSNEVKVENLTCFRNVVVFKTKGMAWSLINVDNRNVAYVEAYSCIPIANDLVLCVVKDGLTLLNTKGLITPEISVIKNYVSSESYAQVEVKPWNEWFSISFNGNVSIVREDLKGNSKVIHLKPKEFGSPIDVVAALKTPIGTFSKAFQITSKPLVLEGVVVKDCSYSVNGKLKDGVSNFKMLLSLTYSKTFPEVPKVLITGLSPGMKITHVNVINDSDVLVNADLNVKEVIKSGSNFLKFKVSMEFFDGVIQDLGLFTVEFNNCREVKEPPTTLRLEELQNGVLSISTSAGVPLRVICGGKVLSGVRVDVEDCEPPIVIDEYLTYEGYIWVKTHVVRCLPKVDVVRNNALGFEVRNAKRGGVRCVDYVFTLPKDSALELNFIDVTCDAKLCTLKLSYKSNNPQITVIACGALLKHSYGDEGFLEVTASLKEILSNGIYVFSIPAGFIENLKVYEVPVKDVVRFMLVKGFTLSKVLFDVVKDRA